MSLKSNTGYADDYERGVEQAWRDLEESAEAASVTTYSMESEAFKKGYSEVLESEGLSDEDPGLDDSFYDTDASGRCYSDADPGL